MFTDIVQDLRFSKGAHVELRSQHDPPDGTSRDTSVERFLCERQKKCPDRGPSGMRTETKPVDEPTVIPSATNLEKSDARHARLE